MIHRGGQVRLIILNGGCKGFRLQLFEYRLRRGFIGSSDWPLCGTVGTTGLPSGRQVSRDLPDRAERMSMQI